ncbi:MAG: GNAT family N-acetyltransferase [Clostridiales bacterium]|nr:GNAT family N-acetyltransferase [Clostridiales bacterium]
MELDREIREFCASPCRFSGFVEMPAMVDGELSLALDQALPAQPEKKYVPAYALFMRVGGANVGHINLRIGYTEGLYYGGNIGYGVDEAYRGRGYAGRACLLLVPLMAAHGMTRAIITNGVDNAASRRVCEKLGARLLRVAALPEWTELYQDGLRSVNIFDWRFA